MDQDTKDPFDNLSRFLNENMFTKTDAQEMRAELPDKPRYLEASAINGRRS